MSRAHVDYARRSQASCAFAGHDPDTPVAGLYRMRLRTGGVFVGIRIWHGAPKDPETGEEMDRSHRWQAEANGQPIDLDRVWPRCAADPITQAEHTYLAGLQRWAAEYAPDSPHANPTQRIDPLTAPTPF